MWIKWQVSRLYSTEPSTEHIEFELNCMLLSSKGAQARTTFETTRKRYNKERKTANQTNWKYFDRLKFLDAVIRPRAT